MSSFFSPRRAALARLLETTRRFVELRDNGRYWGDRGFDTARQIVGRTVFVAPPTDLIRM